MKYNYLPYIIFLIFAFSCNEHTPRPEGYARFERGQIDSVEFDHSEFSFMYPSDVEIKNVREEINSAYWFDIRYPDYHATLYCTYLPINEKSLSKALDDSYQLAYSHISKADDISQTQYQDSINRKTGILYDIKGQVAVPLQFYVTDNANNFLRGSFYFDQNVNIDSVSPIIQFVRSDIMHIMESLKWKTPSK